MDEHGDLSSTIGTKACLDVSRIILVMAQQGRVFWANTATDGNSVTRVNSYLTKKQVKVSNKHPDITLRCARFDSTGRYYHRLTDSQDLVIGFH